MKGGALPQKGGRTVKHPALTRMLGIFLAIVSLCTLFSAAVGRGQAEKDRAEAQRRSGYLGELIQRAEALQDALDARQDGYDAVMAVYPDKKDAHMSDSSAFRMDLATYTASRAGLVLGRQQLDDAAAALDESMETLLTAIYLFRDGEEAFGQIYDVYLVLRGTLDQGESIYQQAVSRLPEDAGGDAEVVFTPEEVLALAELGHGSYQQLGEVLTGLRDSTPADQRRAAEFAARAMEEYGEISASMDGFSVELLAYSAGAALYDQAQEAIASSEAAGQSPEEARAAADEICQRAFGLSYDELGQWLEDNRPESAGSDSEGGGLPPEMTELLLGALPDDRSLIDTALELLAEGEQELSESEAAFRADPHDMSAAELLMSASKSGLDASARLLGLVEPTILDTKSQLDTAHEQLDAAWYAIYTAQQGVEDSYRELDEKSEELDDQLEDFREEHEVLAAEKLSLEGMEEIIDEYELLRGRLLSARSELLADDDIYLRSQQGAELFGASRLSLALRKTQERSEHQLRLCCCALMAVGAVFGLVGTLGAFEKPRLKRLWLPVAAALLLCALGEAISLSLGRGLWYSALSVLLFALLILPFCFGNRKGEST